MFTTPVYRLLQLGALRTVPTPASRPRPGSAPPRRGGRRDFLPFYPVTRRTGGDSTTGSGRQASRRVRDPGRVVPFDDPDVGVEEGRDRGRTPRPVNIRFSDPT